jgi:hypothetical protein
MLFGEQASYDLGRRGDLSRQLGLAHADVDTRLVECTDNPVDGIDLSTRLLVTGRELRGFQLLVEELVEPGLASRRHGGTVAFKLREATMADLEGKAAEKLQRPASSADEANDFSARTGSAAEAASARAPTAGLGVQPGPALL